MKVLVTDESTNGKWTEMMPKIKNLKYCFFCLLLLTLSYPAFSSEKIAKTQKSSQKTVKKSDQKIAAKTKADAKSNVEAVLNKKVDNQEKAEKVAVEENATSKKENAALLKDDPGAELRVFEDESVWVSFFKTIMMLLVVLGLVYLVLQKGLGTLMKKQYQGKRMKVVERLNFDNKRSLLLLKIDEKEVLLASSEGGVTLMALDALLANKEAETSFSDVLSKSSKQGSVSDNLPED